MSANRRFRGIAKRSAARIRRSPTPFPETLRGEPYSLFRISARLSVESAGYRFSHAHPELRIEILGRMDLDPDHQVVEARTLGPRAAQYLDELRALPGVSEAEVYSETERGALYRVSLRADAAARAVRTHRVLLRYPIVLQDGWLRFETVAPASRIRVFLRHLQSSVGPARIDAIRRNQVKPGDLGLTVAQEAVFRAAVQAGYFDAPRGVSLTELARRLGRSKSTVSQQLAKIQRRLAESALQLELRALPTGRE